jgi:hypothetical protein
MAILLISTGLNSRIRLEALGLEVVACRPDDLQRRLKAGTFEAVVIDLDEAGVLAVPETTAKVLGFYSHVDEQMAEKARAAGIDAYPRSRFWREAAGLLP